MKFSEFMDLSSIVFLANLRIKDTNFYKVIGRYKPLKIMRNAVLNGIISANPQ